MSTLLKVHRIHHQQKGAQGLGQYGVTAKMVGEVFTSAHVAGGAAMPIKQPQKCKPSLTKCCTKAKGETAKHLERSK